jgi:DNA-directed RNA polymerase sigma subunit (sigma70/sigma32)
MTRKKKPKKTEEELHNEWVEKIFKLGDASPQDGMTLEQISAVLGCSREYVRQLENSALRKVRRALAERGIRQYSDISVETTGTTNPFTED